MLFFWIAIFVVSLLALVKGADWLLESSKKIGLALGFSPFIIGVVLVGIGTSLPEVISSLAAIYQGVPEIPVANAIGSNIANILLIIGVVAVVTGSIKVDKNLIDLDLPLLLATTILFIGVALDGSIVLWEAILLLATFGIYLFYTLKQKGEVKAEKEINKEIKKDKQKGLSFINFVWLIVGIIALGVGANYTIEAVVAISGIIGLPTTVITLLAVAIGTSLPELLVSIKAAKSGESLVAIGNIIGSSVFNLLFVVGVAGLFVKLPLDADTFNIALPMLGAVTLLFVVSGIARRYWSWEGAFFLMIYALFIAKLLF